MTGIETLFLKQTIKIKQYNKHYKNTFTELFKIQT